MMFGDNNKNKSIVVWELGESWVHVYNKNLSYVLLCTTNDD